MNFLGLDLGPLDLGPLDGPYSAPAAVAPSVFGLDLGPLDLGPLDGSPGAVLYRSPAPTGWKSTGRRVGPDPSFATGARSFGQG